MLPESVAAVAGPPWFRIDLPHPDLERHLRRGIDELESRTGVRLEDPRSGLCLAAPSGRPPPSGPGDPARIASWASLLAAAASAGVGHFTVLPVPETPRWATRRDPSSGRAALSIDGRPDEGGLGDRERQAILATLRALESESSNSGCRIEVSFVLVEDGPAFLSWRRSAATAEARIRILADLVVEGSLGEEDALRTVDPASVAALFEGSFDADARARAAGEGRLLARGRPAQGGIARGRLATSPAVVESELGHPESERRPWILAARELVPHDVGAIEAACGVLLVSGAVDSPGAMLSVELGTPCLTAVERMEVGPDEVRFGRRGVRCGEWVSIDASTGDVYEGRLPVAPPEGSAGGGLASVLEWADRRRRMSVRVNADTLAEARQGFAAGAEGIGLCRSEHLLHAPEIAPDLKAVVEHAVAGEAPPEGACARLVRFQQEEYGWLLRTALGRPVAVRLLDLPLHEVLGPASAGGPETNPMLGLRGPRLAALRPEIYGLQLEALRRAAGEVRGEGRPVQLEVLLPMISAVREFEDLADQVRRALGPETAVGAMIEVPRAALLAGEVARRADFLAFGTNDLTQMTLGISRVDGDRFVGAYVDRGWLPADPFRTLDVEGVGRLVAAAVEAARAARPSARIGVCGAHASDPASIRFFESIGIDYLSCPPGLVPSARVAAAQARLG